MSKLVIPGITDPGMLVCISRARNFRQYVKMVDSALMGRCPFCEIDRAHNNVIDENDFWYAWPCNPPEKNTRLHFLFVPKRHVKSTRELTNTEILSLFSIREAVQNRYGYTSCGTLIRDGDATLSAGTIEHLHVHDMVPDGTGRVESPFYKGADSENQGLKRAIVFEKVRTGTVLQDLSEEELELVQDRI